MNRGHSCFSILFENQVGMFASKLQRRGANGSETRIEQRDFPEAHISPESKDPNK